jgi:hypothetical protein
MNLLNTSVVTGIRAPKGVLSTGRVYLLPEEKERMLELYRKGGLSHPALAEQFGVNIVTVRRTLRRASNRR